MLGVQRGASNLYFPDVASSILIPPYSARVTQILKNPRVSEAIHSARVEGQIPDVIFQMLAKLHRTDPEQLKEAYCRQVKQKDPPPATDEVAFRHTEFLALHHERRDSSDALASRPQPLSKYSASVRQFFQAVTLVERLTETRALTGFSRITPGATGKVALSLGNLHWLPAFQVRGEGIFLELSPDRMRALDRDQPDRLAKLVQRASDTGRSLLPPTPGLVFLHTLAHLLIKRLSFEAGYGASSIRERIYSAPQSSAHTMNGILLYTAAGDADGTLGGLVRLGRSGTLERIIAGALEDARWCASDPICVESKGQGPESLNLAACHACALLPETSCEFQNRILDRQTVIDFFED